ncbi:MAG TPA: hypothetical protein VGF82_08440 [Terracidiphilus sp.]
MAIRDFNRVGSSGIILGLLLGFSVTAAGQMSWRPSPGPATPQNSATLATSSASPGGEPESCRVHQVTAFPGSHLFGTDFIETIATDPEPDADDAGMIWGLTADLSESVPPDRQAMYISKSVDGGATWTSIARVDSRYFDAQIAEGLRNGLAVLPGGTEFVITTQRGAFQVVPQPDSYKPVVKAIAGPRVPDSPPKIPIPKKSGEPVRANIVAITADGQRMIIGYGYFDLEPQIFEYHRGNDGTWIEDGPLPPLPTEMDLLSIQFDDPQNPDPGFVYVGTGDQAYVLNLHTKQWGRIHGVGADSAIHAMSIVGGLHIAACWGIYNPAGPGVERRVTNAHFLLHRMSDETGSNLRTYGIDVDPSRPNREVVTSITGVYVSADSGETWKRLSDLPDGEYRSVHFNTDGTVIVSGIPGTFLVKPFSEACVPRLRVRERSPLHN